ncbi:NUMOD3 domain-containing DNA-binding protein [Clostridium perfringens]|nr:NUMOD3 domain-containing DNA-binding protein [Clostridium perfringens]
MNMVLRDERGRFVKGCESIRKGINQPEETKRKISNSLKGRFIGENHPKYGKEVSEETRLKQRNSNRFLHNPELQAGSLNHAAKAITITLFENGENTKYEFGSTIEGKKWLADYLGLNNYRTIENWIYGNYVPKKYQNILVDITVAN